MSFSALIWTCVLVLCSLSTPYSVGGQQTFPLGWDQIGQAFILGNWALFLVTLTRSARAINSVCQPLLK